MSAPEILWRCGMKLRQTADRIAAPGRTRLVRAEQVANVNGQVLSFDSAIPGTHLNRQNESSRNVYGQIGQRDKLVTLADRILRNKLGFFDLETVDYGQEISWNYEPKAKIKTPIGFAANIDYRDYKETGDCKFVWEPNRHAHLVTLGRAWQETGNRLYAEAVVTQIQSWIAQCPYGCGMNWRSPLELAIRLINWVWAIELIRSSGVVTQEFSRTLASVVYRHLWDITRNYSRYSSANNHLIGEAAGVLIGSAYFKNLKNASRWFARSQRILSQEIINQTHADGGNREQAFGYHLFVLEFFLLAGLAARRRGHDFPESYWQRLEKMFEFIAAMLEGGDALPMFGDADDGYTLELGAGDRPDRGLLAIGAVLFQRPDFKAVTGPNLEPLYWMLGPDAVDEFEKLTAPTKNNLESKSFPETGYYLIQTGRNDSQERISLCFDCGELGMGSIAAHGHADALSFVLRIGGTDLLVDPGTYDYFTYPEWRSCFRGTQSHNTVTIDDKNQSEMLGSFLWGQKAQTRCVRWEPGIDGGTIIGEHNGYTSLSEPVMHSRSVTVRGQHQSISVSDFLKGRGSHTASIAWHFAEHWHLQPLRKNQFVATNHSRKVLIECDPRLSTTLYYGSDNPPYGWVSRGYHKKVPAFALVGKCEWTEKCEIVTRIAVVGNDSCLQPEVTSHGSMPTTNNCGTGFHG